MIISKIFFRNIKEFGYHINNIVFFFITEKAFLFHVRNIIAPCMIQPMIYYCFVIKVNHTTAIKMRIDNLFRFTIIPHCIIGTVCPMLKENAFWCDMQTNATFFDTRMFEQYFHFLRRYMIYCNFVSYIEIKIIFIKTKITVAFAFINKLFLSQSKISEINSSFFTQLIISAIRKKFLRVPCYHSVSYSQILYSSMFFNFNLTTSI